MSESGSQTGKARRKAHRYIAADHWFVCVYGFVPLSDLFEEPPRRRAARLETKRVYLGTSTRVLLASRVPLSRPFRLGSSPLCHPPTLSPATLPVALALFLYYYVFAIYLCLHPGSFLFLLSRFLRTVRAPRSRPESRRPLLTEHPPPHRRCIPRRSQRCSDFGRPSTCDTRLLPDLLSTSSSMDPPRRGGTNDRSGSRGRKRTYRLIGAAITEVARGAKLASSPDRCPMQLRSILICSRGRRRWFIFFLRGYKFNRERIFMNRHCIVLFFFFI